LSYLRWGKKTFANLRPIKYFKGLKSPLENPEGIDFVIVLENLEGLYPGREGDVTELIPLKIRVTSLTSDVLETNVKGKYAIRIITEENTRNICEMACQVTLKEWAKVGRAKLLLLASSPQFLQSNYCLGSKKLVLLPN
jgi:isocitrate/isopropylmalate dehydrogenase